MWAWGMRGLVGLLAELAVGAVCCPTQAPLVYVASAQPTGMQRRLPLPN